MVLLVFQILSISYIAQGRKQCCSKFEHFKMVLQTSSHWCHPNAQLHVLNLSNVELHLFLTKSISFVHVIYTNLSAPFNVSSLISSILESCKFVKSDSSSCRGTRDWQPLQNEHRRIAAAVTVIKIFIYCLLVGLNLSRNPLRKWSLI